MPDGSQIAGNAVKNIPKTAYLRELWHYLPLILCVLFVYMRAPAAIFFRVNH